MDLEKSINADVMVSGFGCFFEGIFTLPNFIKITTEENYKFMLCACDMTAIVTEHPKLASPVAMMELISRSASSL